MFGADLNLTAGRAGHLYLGVARTQATNAAPVSGAIEILNARGGPELIENYLGPASNGTGSLTTFGAQYDLSLSKAAVRRLVHGHLARRPDQRVRHGDQRDQPRPAATTACSS